MVNYEIREEDGKIHVYVEVSFSRAYRGPGVKIRTSDVKEYLKSKNIKFSRLLKKDTAHNKFAGSGKGHWVFEKKVEKVLDPEPKSTTIEEEKPVRTRKRRTRSSIKKVSTEE